MYIEWSKAPEVTVMFEEEPCFMKDFLSRVARTSMCEKYEHVKSKLCCPCKRCKVGLD
jgi:hypothetical protein